MSTVHSTRATRPAQQRFATRAIFSRPYGTPISHAFLCPGAVRKSGEPLLGYVRSSLRDWEARRRGTLATGRTTRLLDSYVNNAFSLGHHPSKVVDRAEQMEVLQLGLSSKPVDPRDLY